MTARTVGPVTRLRRMRDGIAALHDATRALRGAGSVRQAGSNEQARDALFVFASLTDRLSAFADDQRDDDWAELWVPTSNVTAFRAQIEVLRASSRGIAATTLPALEQLADDLALLVTPDE